MALERGGAIRQLADETGWLKSISQFIQVNSSDDFHSSNDCKIGWSGIITHVARCGPGFDKNLLNLPNVVSLLKLKLVDMQTAVFKSDSKSNLKLLIELAKKLGIKAKLLSETEVEDIGLANAIKIGRTGEFADTDIYLEKLRK